jgi:G3E family GTPase
LKVAVITNDQGDQQVDSEYVKAFGIPHGDIGNGCFCCRYEELSNTLSDLISKASPDVVFAEAVGSCADLVATVAKPLEKNHPELQLILTVFIDASLFLAILEGRASFITESVKYIFRKQIEEADILIINKKDCIAEDALLTICGILTKEYPAKLLLVQNSLNRVDVEEWVERCMAFQKVQSRQSLDIDYDQYGQGEADLSWGDKLVTVESPNQNAVEAVEYFIGRIFDEIQRERLAIGHLKFFIKTGIAVQNVSFTTMSTSRSVKLTVPPSFKVDVTINARVQTSPEMLEQIVNAAIEKSAKLFQSDFQSTAQSFFRPGYPSPTHRIR